jgi:sulfate adenylyltransferase subunit 2
MGQKKSQLTRPAAQPDGGGKGRQEEGWLTGFEPATSGTTNQRSNQLSYNHHQGLNPTDHNQTSSTVEGEGSHPEMSRVAVAGRTPYKQAQTNDHPAKTGMSSYSLTHLKQLEAESIHIIREVAAEFQNPVMLYSIGKDSACMLRLAQKAFYPAKIPFPLMHVDTTWKFQDMYRMRDDYVAKELGLDLIVHVNEEGRAQGINPITHGSQVHTNIMKTESLKQALTKHRFDAAFGGARRDEEKSRAKERVFSFRDEFHRWDPKNQRPELWNLYNTKVRKGESIRVFPLSNWTELDVWQYIHLEQIPIVPLYFAAERPIVWRDGVMIMVDDERLPLKPGETPEMRKVRFRTLGCYPLSGAVDSNATTLPEIIQEMLLTTFSERQGRLIDSDEAGSMEKKKREGYF